MPARPAAGCPAGRSAGSPVARPLAGSLVPRRCPWTVLVELSGVPPCAARPPPAPPSGSTASRRQRQCQRVLGLQHSIARIVIHRTRPAVPSPDGVPGPLDDVAEADAARLVAAELDEGDLVGRDQNPAALLRGQSEDRGAVWRAECRREVE